MPPGFAEMLHAARARACRQGDHVLTEAIKVPAHSSAQVAEFVLPHELMHDRAATAGDTSSPATLNLRFGFSARKFEANMQLTIRIGGARLAARCEGWVV